jgi:hypothetical protein
MTIKAASAQSAKIRSLRIINFLFLVLQHFPEPGLPCGYR